MPKRKTHVLPLWKPIALSLFIFFIVLALVYVKYSNNVKGNNTEKIIAKLSQNLPVPPGKPNIINIDEERLKKLKFLNPDFFQNAKAGDIIFQYGETSILYDPKTDKIINLFSVGAFNKPKPDSLLKISFRFNGQTAFYRAQLLQQELFIRKSQYQITGIEPSKAEYKEDAIYIVNKNKRKEADELARLLGNSPIVEQPDPNETKSTDIDMIVSFADK